MASTTATTGTSGVSTGAPETVPTGYQGGTPTGGAATSTPSTPRDLNEGSAFATEVSPAAQVTSTSTLQNEFPEEVGDFQAAQEAKRAAVAEARAAEPPPPNFGLVQNPETGEYEWAPWTDAAGSTDNATAASRENFDTSTFTAYNSTDVEDTLVAFGEASTTDEVEEETSDKDYYYGLLEDEYLPTNREDDSEGNV